MKTSSTLKDITILEVASEQLVTNMAGKFLADYGVTLKRAGPPFSDPNLSQHKIHSSSQFHLETYSKWLEQCTLILFHEDHIGLSKTIQQLQKACPQVAVLVIHRTNSTSKQKYNDVQLFALSGLLDRFGQTSNPQKQDNLPQAPPLLASTVSAVGVATRILQAVKQKEKGVIRFSMLHNIMYLGNFHLNSIYVGLTSGTRGQSMLEGGAPFYRIYETKDSYLAVGNIESKFYQQMLKGLGLDTETNQYLSQNQMSVSQWPKMINVLDSIFKSKSTLEWTKIMDSLDTCITPIYNLFPCSEIQPSPRLSGHLSIPFKSHPKIVPKL